MVKRTLYNFSFVAGLLLAFAFPAHAAVLRLSPASATFILGSTFDVSVILNTEGAAANTVEAELHFPPEKLQIANPSLGKSIVQIWASPPTFSNQEGKIYFIGGIPTPGVNTSEGIVQSFTFRVVAPGEAKISFGPNTSVLANDGLGTNILKQTSPALFKLLLPPAQGPEVFSPTHPEQGKWYNDPNPTLKWTAVPSSQGFSYRIDHSPSSAPDAIVRTADSEVTFNDLESGSWYFHVREKAGGSWGGTSHYAVNIDTQPPAAFGVDVSPSLRTTEARPILRFFTTDARSGFDHFEVKMVPLSTGPGDSSFFFEASSPYQLSGLKPGRYEVVVRAYDKAGNFRDESVTLTLLSSRFQIVSPEGVDLFVIFVPWTVLLPIVLALALLFVIVLVAMWVRHRHHLTHAFWEDIKNIGMNKNRSQNDGTHHE